MGSSRQRVAEMTIRSRLEDVPLLVMWMEERLASSAEELRERVIMAAVEAVHNVIRHGGLGELGSITAQLAVRQSGARLDLDDDATPFPLDLLLSAELPNPDPQDPSTWAESGIGLGMIRAAADAIGYRREGQHNKLTLEFLPRDERVVP